jgi:outer membrane protein assembly factor BamA
MRHTIGALVLGGILLSAASASAETTYTIDSVTITGSKTVPVEKLYEVISLHKGSKATQADVVADRDAIQKVLEDSHVGGNIQTRMAGRGTHVDVVFTLNDQGVQAPVVTKVAPKLHAEMFAGNKSIPDDKLIAASGLHPGDELTNEKMATAQKAIIDVYKAAKLPISTQVSFTDERVGATSLDVTWHVVETKLKAPKNAESQDSQDKIN